MAMEAPPPMMPVVDDCCTDDTGWYFRGFLGTTNYDLDRISNPAFDTADFTFFDLGYESSGFGGLGVGWKFNNWLRFDTTWEYRSKSTFHGLDRYVGPGFSGTNQYQATMKSWVWMNSLYWDVFCWNGFKPYVGAGIGYAANYIDDFSDINTPNLGVAYGDGHREGNFAWSVTAGLGYQVNNRVTLDLAYRYLDLGEAMSGNIRAYDGSGGVAEGLKFEDVHSHDLMLGVRYKFGGCCDQPVAMPVAFK
ncbi:outer membrane beta-barrel protein [Methyloligella sp. 2.7D]